MAAVEGVSRSVLLATGVTAQPGNGVMPAIAAGADNGCWWHHGYFWKAEITPITGMQQRPHQGLAAMTEFAAYHLAADVSRRAGPIRATRAL